MIKWCFKLFTGFFNTISICVSLAFILAVLSLWITWNWDSALLSEPWKPMSPLSVWLFIILTAGIITFRVWPSNIFARSFSYFTAFSVALLGVLVLLCRYAGTDLFLERWLWPSPVIQEGMVTGRMSPVSAMLFMMSGIALLLILPPMNNRWIWRQFSAALGAGIGLTGLAVLIGYWSGAPFFYESDISPVSLMTGAEFVLIGIALIGMSGYDTWPLFSTKEEGNFLKESPRWYHKWLIGLTIVLLSLIVYAGHFYVDSIKAEAKISAQKQLTAIADLKVQQVSNWMRERYSDAMMWIQTPYMVGLIRSYLAEPNEPLAQKDLEQWISRIKSACGYTRAVLFNRDLEPHIIGGGGEEWIGKGIKERIKGVFQTGSITMSDIHFREQSNEPCMGVMIPIKSSEPGGKVFSVLLLNIDPREFLYPLIQTWPVPSRTAETLLVEKRQNEVLYLNELRHRKNTAMILRVPMGRRNYISGAAVEGRRGAMEGVDYRNVKVLAVIREVPGVPWILVAKMDQKEVYSALRGRIQSADLIFFIFSILVLQIMSLLWHRTDSVWMSRQLAMEKERQLLTERLELALDSAKMGVFEWDIPADKRTWDARLGVIMGLVPGTFSGRAEDFFKLIYPDDLQAVKEGLSRATEKGPYEVEYRVAGPGGGLRNISARGKVHYDDRGRPLLLSGVCWDNTQQQQIEQVLKENERRFRAIFNSTFQMIWLLSPDGRLMEANQAALEFAGATIEEIRGKLFYECPWWQMDESTREKLRLSVLRAVKGEFIRYTTDIIGRNSRILPVDFSIKPVKDAEGNVVLIIPEGRDIAEIREAQNAMLAGAEEIQRMGKEWKATFDATKDLIMIMDKEYRIKQVNKATLDLLDVTEENIVGKCCYKVIHGTSTMLPECPLSALMASNKHEEREIFIKDWNIWALISVDPLFDKNGELMGVVHIIKDITEWKLAEEAKERNLLEIQAKTEDMETLLYLVSHDLRSPLVNVQGFSGILKKACDEVLEITRGENDLKSLKEKIIPILEEKIPSVVNFIFTSGTKMDILITGLLRLARLGRVPVFPGSINMSELVRGILDAMTLRIEEKGCVIETGALPDCKADKGQVGQVFSNLIDNAVKYLYPGRPGKIRIEGKEEGGNVVYKVEDNGVGIPPACLDKIWTMFYRVSPKSDIPGEGLGLVAVKKILSRNGGSIRVESEENKGSAFFVTLPKNR